MIQSIIGFWPNTGRSRCNSDREKIMSEKITDMIVKASSIRKATTEIINETEYWSTVVCNEVYWSPLTGDWVVLIDSSEDATLIAKIVAGLHQLGHDVSVISG